MSRYAATTPKIQKWFDAFNAGKSYDAQVRPFGFLNAFTGLGGLARPVAPFERDPGRSASSAFDRNTGDPVAPAALASYARALAQYHLHAEAKFANGRPLDSGMTQRRRVVASGRAHIGKEADRWEEQFFIGADPDAPVEYGSAPSWRYELADELEAAVAQVGQRELADSLGIARETLRRLRSGDRRPASTRTRAVVARRLARFWAGRAGHDARRREALHWARSESERHGLTRLADRIGCDPSNLAKVLDGRRTFGGTIAAEIMKLALRSDR